VACLEPRVPLFFSTFTQREILRKIPTDELHTGTNFQRFLSKAMRSSFKKLVVSTPSLLQGLRTMSLAKSVPKGLKPQECERTKLREPPPVPYIPVKDEIQEEVAKMQNLQIKTLLEKDTTLHFLVWHKNGTQEAFLMHVMAVMDALKKCGTFKDYERAQKAWVEAKKAVELAEAGLALLDSTGARPSKSCKKKALAKAKEAAKEALAKTHEIKSETNKAEEVTKVTDDMMKAGFQVDLEKAMKAFEVAKGAMTAAASQMFTFYSNLLFPESKCLWNKIVSKQTKSCESTRCLS
jgi:hypothetical protein